MREGLGPFPEEQSHRPVLSMQKGEDGRLRLLPRPPPVQARTKLKAKPKDPPEHLIADQQRFEAAAHSVPQRGTAELQREARRVMPEVGHEVDQGVQQEAENEVAGRWPEVRPLVVFGAGEPVPNITVAATRLIEFQGVSVRYAKEAALTDLSLSIDSGELVALVGPSGAGKTTALRLLQGLVRPTDGKLWIGGVSVHRTWAFRIRRLRRRIGVIYQDYRLLENRTAIENVAFALQVADLTVPRAEARRRAEVQLGQVGLAGREKARPYQLSGGQQQRLAIARALVARPRILLADEPTASLDAAQARNVLRLFKQISDSGTTVVLATHDRALLNGSGVRTVRLSKGRIVSDQPRRGKLWVIQ